MQPKPPPGHGFKRQVVIRVSADDWPLLEQAAVQHGSLQAALLAGLRALAQQPTGNAKPTQKRAAVPARSSISPTPAAPQSSSTDHDPAEEIHAREAAKVLGLKSSTVSGYIRSGRIAGRYDGQPTWQGWMTTRGAVDTYQRSRNSAHKR